MGYIHLWQCQRPMIALDSHAVIYALMYICMMICFGKMVETNSSYISTAQKISAHSDYSINEDVFLAANITAMDL
jgi:hypothetical protein